MKKVILNKIIYLVSVFKYIIWENKINQISK